MILIQWKDNNTQKPQLLRYGSTGKQSVSPQCSASSTIRTTMRFQTHYHGNRFYSFSFFLLFPFSFSCLASFSLVITVSFAALPVTAHGQNADVDIVTVQAFTQLPWTEWHPLRAISCVYKVCVVLNVFQSTNPTNKSPAVQTTLDIGAVTPMATVQRTPAI